MTERLAKCVCVYKLADLDAEPHAQMNLWSSLIGKLLATQLDSSRLNQSSIVWNALSELC